MTLICVNHLLLLLLSTTHSHTRANHTAILMKNDLVALASTHHMYEGIARTSHIFNEILDRMYSSHKIDSTFSALGKAIGDDYNVSDRAFGKCVQ